MLLDIYREQGTIFIKITSEFAHNKQYIDILKKMVKLITLYARYFLPVKEGYQRYSREKAGYKRRSGHPIKFDIQ